MIGWGRKGEKEMISRSLAFVTEIRMWDKARFMNEACSLELYAYVFNFFKAFFCACIMLYLVKKYVPGMGETWKLLKTEVIFFSLGAK